MTMDTPDSGKATNQRAGRRACEDCNDYTDHMGHEGLVYRFFNDDKGKYHRHIAFCTDYVAANSKLVN
jgi:hypothetical protein